MQVGPAPIEGAAVLAREAGDGSLTVDTIFLRRIYLLFFISLATRRIEYIACSSNPDGRWVSQQARNLAMAFEGQHPFRFLIHDRDTKFSCAFDEVFRTEGIKVIRTPVQAPNANAFAERWARTVRTDRLDRILILGRRHLKHVRRVYRGPTTSTGHTALSNCSRPSRETQRLGRRPPTCVAAICSAGSSTNTRPPEFANPTASTPEANGLTISSFLEAPTAQRSSSATAWDAQTRSSLQNAHSAAACDATAHGTDHAENREVRRPDNVERNRVARGPIAPVRWRERY